MVANQTTLEIQEELDEATNKDVDIKNDYECITSINFLDSIIKNETVAT